ncbi:Beta-lactamase-type transpeptidase fold domain containing protein [Cordyceps fumosorosea ARSEF 2679]|uniref:Beta-lactamase-type transpeptidase fold domain containing protein n=1 Tax=Cordyceps fumosorosea (strain ARSEF 2679) TaxID=1081104 RepID=A0A167KSZ4_CORFA|nr:Beta-lactamase-type transpeptidase fold domain containing protein [Cordyceps fumosorosea ARSEF 2679]OAA52152.1 Beta-lactamase-type transpeptidase fold domain containing protein [Cordyceps fumosorosea ARSEF 2679]
MVQLAEPIEQILADLPAKCRGPGGAVAVLKDGELLGEKVWGFADLQKGIPMDNTTVIPICSISKQMTCGLLTDLQLNPTPAMAARAEPAAQQLADELHKILPKEMIQDTGVTLQLLCNNQSGIRDYWALTVLWGARPETPFSIERHGPQMLQRLKSFQFVPGTQYSYANTNFYILGRTMEGVTGQPLADLLNERMFAPAGMKTAFLCADTATHPGPCVGHEGTEKVGFYPGDNRIEWAGDAGIVASLTDMVAYEKFVDSNRDNAQNWYGLNCAKQTFKDGAPSDYGYGLSQHTVGGVTLVGHGGALRGYRLNRIYAPKERISVVALLNEEFGKAGVVCDYVIERLLGVQATQFSAVEPNPAFIGTYLDPESDLAVTIGKGEAEGKLSFFYHRAAVDITPVEANKAVSSDVTAFLDGDVLEITLPKDNRKFRATRVPAAQPRANYSALHGSFKCAEIDSVFHCTGTDGMLYGSFDGFLGKGPIHLIRPLAEDVFALACPRAMDSSPPGDWTLAARRDASGKINGVTIGCWLARKLEFVRI